MNFSSLVVPADKALADLAALIPPTYAAFETGVEEARTYFAQRRRIPDGHLFPHIVRYEALFRLAATAKIELLPGEDDADQDADGDQYIRLRGLPNSGIQYRSSGYLVRAMKATADGLVPPPRSSGGGRWEYLSQEDQGVLDDLGVAFRPVLRLVLLWQVTPELALDRLSLACPRSANQRKVEVYWQTDLRRPETMVADDLPISVLPGAATGTTGSNNYEE